MCTKYVKILVSVINVECQCGCMRAVYMSMIMDICILKHRIVLLYHFIQLYLQRQWKNCNNGIGLINKKKIKKNILVMLSYCNVEILISVKKGWAIFSDIYCNTEKSPILNR